MLLSRNTNNCCSRDDGYQNCAEDDKAIPICTHTHGNISNRFFTGGGGGVPSISTVARQHFFHSNSCYLAAIKNLYL